MSRYEIEAKVIAAAAEQAGVEKEQITHATHFRNDLNFDSLDEVEFAMTMEDEFGLSIQDDEVQKMLTIGAVVDYIVAHAQAEAAS